jgi:hypothetical protein
MQIRTTVRIYVGNIPFKIQIQNPQDAASNHLFTHSKKKQFIMATLRIFLLFAWFLGAECAFATVQTVPKDSTGQECVHIRLKNGEIFLGKVSKMDEKVLEFKPCYQPDAPIQTIPLTELSQVTNASNKIIFNNEPQKRSEKALNSEKKGVKISNIAYKSTWTSIISAVLLFLLPKSVTIANASYIIPVLTPLGGGLLLLAIVGILVGLLGGIISMALLQGSNNKRARRRAWFALITGCLLLLF